MLVKDGLMAWFLLTDNSTREVPSHLVDGTRHRSEAYLSRLSMAMRLSLFALIGFIYMLD